MRMLMLAAAAGLLASPVMAGQHDQDAKPVKEKKICRSERPTGSNFSKRTCHTREEWQAIDQANADNAQTMLDRSGRRAGFSRD